MRIPRAPFAATGTTSTSTCGSLQLFCGWRAAAARDGNGCGRICAGFGGSAGQTPLNRRRPTVLGSFHQGISTRQSQLSINFASTHTTRRRLTLFSTPSYSILSCPSGAIPVPLSPPPSANINININ
ncbi:hypothetical protein A0H81_07227 [Grifola frondosa]|uniref:Uncharacterized protein n=1 Tax=Grifola frondosa TaxID=5627 RepID=A0A1C7MDA3_GRIFR|nr:hypothetical protein A0H81_07227 [Grifola frondosa]